MQSDEEESMREVSVDRRREASVALLSVNLRWDAMQNRQRSYEKVLAKMLYVLAISH